MVGEFARGIATLPRAARLVVGTARLRRLALVPFLLNTLLFAVGIPLALWWGTKWMGAIIPGDSVLIAPVRLLLQILFIVVLGATALFLFTAVGSILAAPFNAKLSETIEELIEREKGAIYPPEKRDTVGILPGVASAIGRIALFLILYPPLWLLGFIPVIGPVLSPVLLVLYGAFVLSIDLSDPTLERHFPRFRSRIGFILRHRGRYLGLGLGSFLMMIVPGANLLLLPVGVAAATLAYLESDPT